MAPHKQPLGTIQTTPLEDMKLSLKEYAALNAQASNYRVILRFLKASGIDNFLLDNKLARLDLMEFPDDTSGGESSILFLKAIADECNRMDKRIKELSEALVNTTISYTRKKNELKELKKGFWQKVHDFIFETQE